MDVRVTQKHKNPALHREEIVFEIKESKTTPRRKEVREKLAALEGAKPELVIIEKIKTQFGSTNASGKAFVYESQEEMEKTEKRHLIEKSSGIKMTKEGKGPKKEAAQPGPKK